MTHVHYKFSSKLSYDTVVFDGLNITLRDLKIQIMERERLRAGYCDLQITNAQTKEEYKDDKSLIPKGCSVIVKRIPIIGGKSGLSYSKTSNIERSDLQQLHQVHGDDKAMDGRSSTSDFLFFSKMANLADADVSEEDKLKVIMNQSAYGPTNYKCGTVLPANYMCYRCGNTGHHIRNCPYNKDKATDNPVKIKKSTGIPRSFMVEVDDPSIKGAMLTNCGRYAIPAIDAEAYGIGKKEKLAFVPAQHQEAENEEDPVPEELLCLICHDLLSDAVVIPCCGNSYCDDCIRTALLDSEEHICPTCGHYEVSPDTLIANKFLRQAVNNFKKERGHTKSPRNESINSKSQNPPLTQSSFPTQPTVITQSQPLKPHQLIKSQQDPLLYCSKAADTPSTSQDSETPHSVTGPSCTSNTPTRSPQTVQLHLEITQETDAKTQDGSGAGSPPGLVPNPTALPQLMPQVGQPQSVSWNQQESSSGSWSESTPQQLPPPSSSSSSYPPTPPPHFPSSSHFHPFQPLSGYPPGYPRAASVWSFPSLKGPPFPPLCSPPSSPALMHHDWYRNQIKKKERSPHRGSAYRPSSQSSKSKYSHSYPSCRSRSRSKSRSRSRSKGRSRLPCRGSPYRCSSKSKSSHSYPSSRSRSRSRSRSKGRSRPKSPFSHHRDQHTRSQSSQSYSYGYKRLHSPTTSSSSSPLVSYHSRHKSSSDHRHHRKKSATSSSRSRRGGKRHHKEEDDSAGSLASYMLPQYADQMSSLELDTQRYLQWTNEYKEWCEKYLNSYLEHFHQLPPLPPCPFPPDVDKERSRNHSHANSYDRHPSRQTSGTHCHSPPSQSSSDSCSLSYQSSSDRSSKSSPSFSDMSSSPSHSSKDSRSPPSQSSSDSRSTHSDGGAQERCAEKYDLAQPDTQHEGSEEADLQESSQDDKWHKVKNLENLSTLKNKKKHTKEYKQRQGEDTLLVDPEVLMDDCNVGNKRYSAASNPFNNGSSKEEKAASRKALQSLRWHIKSDKCLDREHEKKRREEMDMDREIGCGRGKYLNSRQDFERKHKEKSSKDTHRTDEDRHKNSKAPDSRSEKNRKRKEKDMERSPDDAPKKSKSLKTKTTEDPETLLGEHPYQSGRKEHKPEKKMWPLPKKDIWEEGMQVKPQKKLSINIRLDTKQKEDKTKKLDLSESKKGIEQTGGVSEERKENRGKTEMHENKESSQDEGGLSEDKLTAEGMAGQMFEENSFREEKGGINEEKEDITFKTEDTNFQDLQLWQSVPKGEEQEEESKNQWVDENRMEDNKGEGVPDDQRKNARKGKEGENSGRNDCRGQEMKELVLGAQRARAEVEITGKENRTKLLEKSELKKEMVEGVKRSMETEDGDASKCGNKNTHETLDTAMDNVSRSSENSQERRTAVKTLEDYTDKGSVDKEDELVLIKVPRSKWKKEDSEEEESLPIGSVSAETTTIKKTEGEKEEQRRRSVEVESVTEKNSILTSSYRSLAPSSGRDRPDSSWCTDRSKERGRVSEKQRDRDKEGKVGTRGGDTGRDRKKERKHKRDPPSSSNLYSYSMSYDTERRDRYRKSFSWPDGNFCTKDQNRHKMDKYSLTSSKFKDKDRHSHSWERDQDPSKSSGGSDSRKPRASSPGQELTLSRRRSDSKVEKGEYKVRKERTEH